MSVTKTIHKEVLSRELPQTEMSEVDFLNMNSWEFMKTVAPEETLTNPEVDTMVGTGEREKRYTREDRSLTLGELAAKITPAGQGIGGVFKISITPSHSGALDNSLRDAPEPPAGFDALTVDRPELVEWLMPAYDLHYHPASAPKFKLLEAERTDLRRMADLIQTFNVRKLDGRTS